eukprot:5194262-Amphidinium_carterae.1
MGSPSQWNRPPPRHTKKAPTTSPSNSTTYHRNHNTPTLAFPREFDKRLRQICGYFKRLSLQGAWQLEQLHSSMKEELYEDDPKAWLPMLEDVSERRSLALQYCLVLFQANHEQLFKHILVYCSQPSLQCPGLHR